MAGDLGAGNDSWLGFLGILYRASARSAARFKMISCKIQAQNIAITSHLVLCTFEAVLPGVKLCYTQSCRAPLLQVVLYVSDRISDGISATFSPV